MTEFRLAFKIFWTIVSFVTMTILITPYLVSAVQIARLTPQCERKTISGRECFCCGMTTAFIHIAHGRISVAERSNRGSVPLYAGFFLNDLGFLGSMAISLTKWPRQRKH
jgi:hypothetical protein